METSNPILTHQAFKSVETIGNPMTLQGTVNKTGILLLCTALTAFGTWNLALNSATSNYVTPLIMLGTLGGFIVALITIFKKSWSPITAPLYALLEGLALGGISAVFEARYPGIALQAVALTFGTLAALLFAYRTGFIRATEKFKLGVFAATAGIALTYFVLIVLSFFGISLLNGSGALSIGFSVFVVIIAALNLVIDFSMIEEAVHAGAPAYMEWYGAFGIMVTLIWLYLEILKLLGKTRKQK